MPDEFNDAWVLQESSLKAVFENDGPRLVFGMLEFVLRHPSCPEDVGLAINVVLKRSQAAYRIVDGDTFAPIASEEEAATVVAAVEDLDVPQLAGAKDHYKKAISALSGGDYAGSMRESIHAVESLTKALTGKSTVQDGVKALSRGGHLHVTLADALEKIAAWTNAVGGIRHANAPAAAVPNVVEEDALYMLAICGATISYLKRRGAAAGLI